MQAARHVGVWPKILLIEPEASLEEFDLLDETLRTPSPLSALKCRGGVECH